MVVRVQWAAMVIALPMICLFDTALIGYFGSFGGEACDVYCGPGNLLTFYAMIGVGLVLWAGGMCLIVIEAVRTKVRGWWVWVALVLEIASPLSLTLHLFPVHP